MSTSRPAAALSTAADTSRAQTRTRTAAEYCAVVWPWHLLTHDLVAHVLLQHDTGCDGRPQRWLLNGVCRQWRDLLVHVPRRVLLHAHIDVEREHAQLMFARRTAARPGWEAICSVAVYRLYAWNTCTTSAVAARLLKRCAIFHATYTIC